MEMYNFFFLIYEIISRGHDLFSVSTSPEALTSLDANVYIQNKVWGRDTIGQERWADVTHLSLENSGIYLFTHGHWL